MKNFFSKAVCIVFFALISFLECGCTVKTEGDLGIQEKTGHVVELRLLKSKTMFDQSLIALSAKPSQNHIVKDDSSNVIATWIPVYTMDKIPFSPSVTDAIDDLLYRESDQGIIEILVEKDIYDISIEHIQKIQINPAGLKSLLKPETNDFFIKLNKEGGYLLAFLTNVCAEENRDESVHFYLCFILDNEILFMSEINSPISYPEFWFSLHFRDEKERVKQEKELNSIRERIGF